MVAISVDSSLAQKLVVGVLLHAGIEVQRQRSPALDVAIRDSEDEVRAVYVGKKPSEIDGLQAARRLFRSIGADPTRMRPASEALLRRILKGGSLPRINSAVDAANVVSLRLLLPIGLYDADKIEGDIHLRLGRDTEGYDRIGSGWLNLHGRIGLFDDRGGFGNPTGDSLRTRVDDGTERLFVFLFAPFLFSLESMEEQIDTAARSMQEYLGGHDAGRAFLAAGVREKDSIESGI